MISCSYASSSPIIRGEKDHVRQLVTIADIDVDKPFPEMTITEKDRGSVRTPNDDSVVIECKVANMRVEQIMVYTGSSSDIISWVCLTKLKYD